MYKYITIIFNIEEQYYEKGMYAEIYDISNPSNIQIVRTVSPTLITNYSYDDDDNPSDNPSIEFDYESEKIYNFTCRIQITESGTYDYEAVFYDSIGNEGDTEYLGSISVVVDDDTTGPVVVLNSVTIEEE